ncbi:MAG: hypothetical protein A2176_10740 [Spirochaetes bacterium RBG_13_51_14]|nr:MAG: hypothetical protein A2176_10740 [Spirochaetes bacterium RBG_13_51_14]
MNQNYEAVMQMLPDILYKLDADGHFIYINNSIRNLGYEPEELIYKHFSILIHPEDVGLVQRDIVLDKLFVKSGHIEEHPKFFDERRTGKRITRDLPVRLIPKDYDYIKNGGMEIVASYRVISVGSYHVKPDGIRKEFNGTLGIIRDVTNIKKSEDTLLRCIDYYQYLVEISNDIFFVLAPDGTILFASQSLRRILGYGLGEIAGDNMIDFIHEGDLKEVIHAGSQASSEHPGFAMQCRIIHQNKEWQTFEVNGKVIYDEYAKSMFITAVTRDVTRRAEAEEELKQARNELEQRVVERTAALASVNDQLNIEIENRTRQESAIRDSEKKYRSLVNCIDDIVLDIDPEGVILFVNPAMRTITGYGPEEIIGHNLLEYIHPDDIDGFLDSLRRSRKTVKGRRKKLIETICTDNELRIVKKDGSNVWIEIRCRPEEDAGGGIRGFRGIASDITRKRHAEDEQIRESRIESLSILAAGIAHDFNNLLTAIIGNISLAKINISEDEKNYDILSEAEKASVMAKNLALQLLTFSRGGSPEKKTTSIRNLLMDTTYFVLRGSPIACDFHISDLLWDTDIDRGQISQVIHNIILNARQAMTDGGTIRVTAENTIVKENDSLPLAGGNYIRMSIFDQGHGIPEEIISKIFDPYFSTKTTGSGLGLAISYSIIKKHSGHITVASERGRGTTFTIYLPASHGTAVRYLAADNMKRTARGRILLMDDERIILELGGTMLRHLGYEVAHAAHPGEAVAMYQEARDAGKPFDLVILDLIIPGGPGADKAIESLRNIDAGVTAIVTSGYVDDPVMIHYEKYGFSGALAKPFNMEELQEVLVRILHS